MGVPLGQGRHRGPVLLAPDPSRQQLIEKIVFGIRRRRERHQRCQAGIIVPGRALCCSGRLVGQDQQHQADQSNDQENRNDDE
ncbi:hypothetical protein AB0F81_29460 [Actinoplanes sp. NPDC024001]|uniref:hypothetical protein n=1 Tax=Actinoplanes sp. NPDC024001 TaxID=3154598 RepID=UPI0033E5134A